MKLIKRHEINSLVWNENVLQNDRGNIFMMSWYLDAVFPGWGLLAEDNGHYVLPLTTEKKAGYNFFIIPPFSRQYELLKPVADPELLGSYFKNNIHFIDAAFGENFMGFNYKFITSASVYQLLRLSPDFESLKNNFNENTRRNIKTAEKTGLHIREVNPDRIVQLFQSEKGKVIKTLNPSSYKILLDLMNACLANNSGVSYGVFSDKEMIAAGFFMFFKDQIIYLKGASGEAGKKAGAMHFLFDFVIRKYCNNYTIFDFGGSRIPSIARFFKGFGADDNFYYRVCYNNLPFHINLLRKIKKRFF